MDLTRVILGPIVTEKSERLKIGDKRMYTFRVANGATKIDVKKALHQFYDFEAVSVRMIRVHSKERAFGKGAMMEKRQSFKKAVVTASPKSKPLDLAHFKTS